jgi:hypothetical protein
MLKLLCICRDGAHVCHFDNCEHSLKASPDTPRQCWRERHKGGMLMSGNERGVLFEFLTLYFYTITLIVYHLKLLSSISEFLVAAQSFPKTPRLFSSVWPVDFREDCQML